MNLPIGDHVDRIHQTPNQVNRYCKQHRNVTFWRLLIHGRMGVTYCVPDCTHSLQTTQRLPKCLKCRSTTFQSENLQIHGQKVMIHCMFILPRWFWTVCSFYPDFLFIFLKIQFLEEIADAGCNVYIRSFPMSCAIKTILFSFTVSCSGHFLKRVFYIFFEPHTKVKFSQTFWTPN